MSDAPTRKRYDSGYYGWQLNNLWHREDGPAILYDNGHEEWYIHGRLHRAGGPAITFKDGSYEWHLNGQCHRDEESGPSCYVSRTKTCYWYKNDVLHRVNGPAVVRDDGEINEWFLNGVRYSEEEHYFQVKMRYCDV